MFRRRPLARMAVRTSVVAGTAALVAGSVAKSQTAAPDSAPAVPAEGASAPGQPAPQPAVSTAIDQLTQLAALKDSGVLTDAEFETQKAKILG